LKKAGDIIKTLIKNCNIVNFDGRLIGDILIENNIIKKISNSIEFENLKNEDITIIDAEGRMVFPGFIDAHTHPGLPEDLGFHKATNDFYTESKAALAGGTTTIFDFAQQSAGERLIDAVNKRKKRSKEHLQCKYELHTAVTELKDDIYEQLKEIKNEGINSVKLYTTYGMKLENFDILKVMEYCAKLDITVLVHCEDDNMIKFCSKKQEYYLSRPRESEISMVGTIASYAKVTGCNIYFCHISCRESIDIIKKAKQEGVNAYLETCPQYLLLNSSKYHTCNRSEVTKFILSPPLREEEDNNSLIKACLEGTVDLISTDHCAFLYEEHKAKYCNDIAKAAKGMPGIQLRASLMYDLLVEKNKLKEEDFVKLLSYNPAWILGLMDRGYIKEGMAGDIVIWDTSKFTVSMDMIEEGTDYSPYEGMELNGRPVCTITISKN
jgi:dihydropyrimidinase